MTSRLFELAALCVALILVGAILTEDGIEPESRAAAVVAILGGMLVVASMRRVRP